MAQLSRTLRQDIDWLLECSFAAWQSLPDVEAEIDHWDLIDQIVFIEEWPIEEDRLTDLRSYAAEGALSTVQLARYDSLMCLVEQNRPIIRRLQES